MGRLHKKKLAEYAEAAEQHDEQQQKRNSLNEKEPENSNNAAADGAADKTGSSVDSEGDELDVTKTGKNSTTDELAECVVDDEADDCQSAHEEDSVGEKNGGGKKTATKRKAIAPPKKDQEKSDEKFGHESEDEPMNGSGGNAPAKRGRKANAVKPKAKATKAAAGTGRVVRGVKKAVVKKAVVKNDDEYEVKEIIDHKVERGTTHYLIRWKGYTKDADTWEAEDILSCPDIIQKYKKKISNYDLKATQKKRGSPAKKGAKRGAAKTASKEEENKEWEVENIIDYAVEKNGRLFRIRWKGFGPKNDTWEPEKNLYCDDLIQKFMKRMESQKNISFKELRESPKKTKRLVNETIPRTNYHNPIGRKSKRGVSKKSDE